MPSLIELALVNEVLPTDQFILNRGNSASGDRRVMADELGIYTSGTWTPTVTASSGSGQTYSLQLGQYVQINKLVIAPFIVTLSSKGTLSGGLTLAGLPATIANVANMYAANAIMIDNVTYAAGLLPYTVLIPNDVRCYLVKSGSGANSFITAAEIGNTSTIRGTLLYLAA